MTLRLFVAAACAAALMCSHAFAAGPGTGLNTRQCPADTLNLFVYCRVGR